MDPTTHNIAADMKECQLETDPPITKEYQPCDIALDMEYITEKNRWPDRGQIVKVTELNIITKYDSLDSFRQAMTREKSPSVYGRDYSENIYKLIQKIEENIEMLVQLEYAARGTSPSDVRDCHIKLMLQLVRSWDGSWYSWDLYYRRSRLLVVTETTPLYVLGAVFSTAHTNIPVIIAVASKNMEPLCQFLIQICQEVGLPGHSLVYVNIDDINEIYEGNLYTYVINDLQEKAGCTGVITDNSGLTSAFEAITKSSNSITAPWRFTQLCVHESIIENLKRKLGAQTEITEKGSLICSNKRFLIEQPTVSECNTGVTAEPMDQDEPNKECSTHSEKATVINVYTYSTTEELLKRLNTPYLSVWGSDDAHAHTLALKTNADVIWINDHAAFEGPPRAAFGVYRLYYNYYCRYTTEVVGQLLEPWRKKNVFDRFKIVIAALKKNEAFNVLDRHMLKWRPESDNLLQVTEKTICFGIRKEAGIIFFYDNDETEHIFQILKAVVYGSAVIYEGGRSREILNNFTEFGIPVFKCDECDDKQSQIVQYPIFFERFKIVRTKF